MSVVATAPMARAQCGLQWQPGVLPGADAAVLATCSWDPDGPGPQTAIVVLGGGFTAVGGFPAEHIAFYDPSSAQLGSLGLGMQGAGVQCLVALPNGDLVAGGSFWSAGGNPAANVARWDGTNWTPLGSGTDGQVLDLAVAPNGDLFAAGWFSTAGGVAASSIARWDGSNWSALGSGITGWNRRVQAVTVMANGDVIAGGEFISAGGVSTPYIARWDGTAWSGLGSGMGPSTSSYLGVLALAVLPNGDLVAGGEFTIAGGVQALCVARWDGTSWSAMGPGLARVLSLRLRSNGNLVAGTSSTLGMVEWDGTAWSPPPVPLGGLHYDLVELPNGDLLVAGGFITAGGVDAWCLARWNGVSWSALAAGNPPSAPVSALLAMPNGDLLARGSFTRVGGANARGIARWDGTAWSAPGSGVGATPASVWAAMPNGDLVLGGATGAWGNPLSGLFRWNGSTWTQFAPPLSGQVNGLAVLPNGEFVAGGSFWLTGSALRNLARWNGSSWIPFAGGVNGSISRMFVTRTGDLVVTGSFTAAGGVPAQGLARWNGSTWSAFGGGVVSGIECMAEMQDGDLVCGGIFTSIGGVPIMGLARWNGATWSALGTGIWGGAKSLEVLPNGDLIACGGIVWINGSEVANDIARWNGTAWSTVGSGFRYGRALAIAQMPNGELIAGGEFSNAGGFGSAFLARLASDCAASARPYGVGCASSVGMMTLTPTTLPWIGGTFRASGTGIAPNGLAFLLLGSTPLSTPLSFFHPLASPGCLALSSAEGSLWVPTPAGTASIALPIPNSPAFVGVMLHHQLVQGEFDPTLQILSLSSSNGLVLTIGAL